MRYFFKTVWDLPASVPEVWELIRDAESWPQWWKGVLSVEKIKDGNADDLGSVYVQTWKSALPYKLKFVVEISEVQKHICVEGKASGELDGTGRWLFSQNGEGTRLVYEWDVKTTSTWMNILAPLLRPAFAWNHNVVMEWGRRGILKRLNR